MITVDEIRDIAAALPGAFEQPSYGGRPSRRTKRRMFTWVREDLEALVVWAESVEERDALVAADPGTFFTTSHYDGHPIVLVRLDTVDRSKLADCRLPPGMRRARGPWRLSQYPASGRPTVRRTEPTTAHAALTVVARCKGRAGRLGGCKAGTLFEGEKLSGDRFRPPGHLGVFELPGASIESPTGQGLGRLVGGLDRGNGPSLDRETSRTPLPAATS